MVDWDYKKNAGIPNDFTPNSNKRVFWRCEHGHSWDATIKSRHSKNAGSWRGHDRGRNVPAQSRRLGWRNRGAQRGHVHKYFKAKLGYHVHQ